MPVALGIIDMNWLVAVAVSVGVGVSVGVSVAVGVKVRVITGGGDVFFGVGFGFEPEPLSQGGWPGWPQTGAGVGSHCCPVAGSQPDWA